MTDEPTTEPEAPKTMRTGEPLPLMTPNDIIAKARGVVTGELLLADLNDRDWQQSLMLMLSAYKGEFPANASLLFLVPLAPHAHGHWLNGRVPGLTMSCEMVPAENVDAFLDQLNEFVRLLHPEVDADHPTPDTVP